MEITAIKQIKDLKDKNNLYLNIAYNAICLGQLDELYSESRLADELGCTVEELKEIMES